MTISRERLIGSEPVRIIMHGLKGILSLGEPFANTVSLTIPVQYRAVQLRVLKTRRVTSYEYIFVPSCRNIT